jgi:hypothetical protein
MREVCHVRFLDPRINMAQTGLAYAHFFAGRNEDASTWAARGRGALIGPALAAGRAGEPTLDVRQPNLVGPAIHVEDCGLRCARRSSLSRLAKENPNFSVRFSCWPSNARALHAPVDAG